MFIRNRLIWLCLGLFSVAVAPAISQSLPLRFTAFAVSTGGPLTPAAAGNIDITVTRWSTEAETKRLVTALQEGGHEALLERLQDVEPVGRIYAPGTLGFDLRYAHAEDIGDGIRRIVLATDRPMSFYEVVNRPRTADYPFTFIELRVNEDGEGEGKLALLSAVSATPSGRIQVYNYDSAIQLNEVRRVRY